MNSGNTCILGVDMKRQLNSGDEEKQCNKQIVINNQDENNITEEIEEEYSNSNIITDQNNEDKEEKIKEDIIIVWAGGTHFTIDRNILIERSLYFKAMFEGGFKEKYQQEIDIQLICAEAMEFIMDYLQNDEITRKYETLIEEDMTLAVKYYNAAIYFQIPHLLTNMESVFIEKLTAPNWYYYWKFADEMNLPNLKNKCMCFAVYKFNEVRKHIDRIDNIQHLHWYLSHRYLNANSEYDVFKTGCEWLKKNEHENGILVVLSCLDYTKIQPPIFNEILSHELVVSNYVAELVIKGILTKTENRYDFDIENDDNLSLSPNENEIQNKEYDDKLSLSQKENVKNIIKKFITCSSKRIQPETPCIAGKINNESHLFAVQNRKLTKYLKLIGDNWWGYNVVKWDDFNIIIACGEIGKGRSVWNKDIIRYNILTEKWKVLNKIPNKPRRHAGAVVKNNFLYLIAGVGQFRQTISSVIKYDLVNDKWIDLPDLLETCQMPVAVFDDENLYVAGEHLYTLNESTKNDWVNLGKLKLRHTSTFVLGNSIYFTTNWSKFITKYDKRHSCYLFAVCENRIKSCTCNIAAACNSGNFVYVFTETGGEFEGKNSVVTVERCYRNESENCISLLCEYHCDDTNFVADRSGCFTFININIKDEHLRDAVLEWLQ